jgi:hypothetical protein
MMPREASHNQKRRIDEDIVSRESFNKDKVVDDEPSNQKGFVKNNSYGIITLLHLRMKS